MYDESLLIEQDPESRVSQNNPAEQTAADANDGEQSSDEPELGEQAPAEALGGEDQTGEDSLPQTEPESDDPSATALESDSPGAAPVPPAAPVSEGEPGAETVELTPAAGEPVDSAAQVEVVPTEQTPAEPSESGSGGDDSENDAEPEPEPAVETPEPTPEEPSEQLPEEPPEEAPANTTTSPWTFDTDEQGWLLGITYPSTLAAASSLSFTDAEGATKAGALVLELPLSSDQQRAFVQVPLSPVDLTGRSLSAYVNVAEGMSDDPNYPSTIKLFVKSGADYVFASGAAAPVMAGSGWVNIHFNLANPAYVDLSGDFDVSDIREIGLELHSGYSATAVKPAIIYVDDVEF